MLEFFFTAKEAKEIVKALYFIWAKESKILLKRSIYRYLAYLKVKFYI